MIHIKGGEMLGLVVPLILRRCVLFLHPFDVLAFAGDYSEGGT